MRPLLIAVVALCMSYSARAEEVIGPNDVAEAVAVDVTPVAAPVVTNLSEGVIVVDVPFYWDALCDAGLGLLGIAWKALFTIGGIWILRKIVGAERAKLVKDAIGVSVDYTWDDMGRELKHALKPGEKLPADQRQKLRNKCGSHTLTILKGAAKALFESYSVSQTNAMIASAVEKRKAISSVGK